MVGANGHNGALIASDTHIAKAFENSRRQAAQDR